MDGHDDGVMIALLPVISDWCQLELPHMTLVYVGHKDDLKPSTFNDLAKDASSLASLSGPLTLRVLDKKVFGGDDELKVDVFRLRPTPELLAMRRTLEVWNASEFPFSPHVTIGPVGTFVENPPSHIAFNRIMVGWGDEQLTFWLKSY